MAARPCPISLTGCPGVDSPITNVSAEAADPLLFAAEAWDLYDPYKPPRLGDGISIRRDCAAIVNAFSIYDPIIYAGSQALANLMALAQSLGCTWPSRPGVTYGNDEQTGTVYCSSGAAFSYTVPADTVTFTTDDVELGTAFVQWANAWAAAYAFEQASALLDCPSGDPDNPPPPGDDPPTFPSGPGVLNNPSWMCFGEEYHDTYRVSGARTVGYTFEVISGTLPPGTTLTQTGPRVVVISGTPTAPGQYTWTIRGTSTSMPTTTVQFTDSLWVMGITNASSLPNGIEGTPYGPELLLATGGTSPFTFSSSNLPAGFSIASNGTLTSDGTTTADDYTFDVTITDSRGGECTQTCSVTIETQCPDWSGIAWTAPTFDNGIDGSAAGSALGATAQFSGKSGTANCAWCRTMVGTLVYTGGAFDAYVYIDVTKYIDFPTPGTKINWGFNVKIGATFYAQVFNLAFPTNSFRIIDADGTRTFNGDLPGSFVVHFHIPASVAATIRFEGTGTGWFEVCPDLLANQTELDYNFTVSCTPPP